MRPAFELLKRFLLTLALVVAAMPARASAPDRAPVRPSCAMPCCAAKAVAKMVCAVPERVAKVTCPCDLRPGPAIAPVRVKDALPTLESVALVSASPALEPAASPASWAEPGVFGIDSGPPSDPPPRSNASRAPPVVRA